ncbi:MAG: SRPBCC family protein [Acidimicrobiia bacterium]
MEIDIERQERITAPLLLVWDEIDSLEQILAKSPQAFSYDMVPGGGRATIRANLAWGPLKWSVEGETVLADLVPQHRITYALDVPSLELHYEATIEVDPVGDGETKLDYRGHLEARGRMANRMRGMFSQILEEHGTGIVRKVKVKAEQRRLAQERLLK